MLYVNIIKISDGERRLFDQSANNNENIIRWILYKIRKIKQHVISIIKITILTIKSANDNTVAAL
jgi:hypothetical protein